MPAWGYREAFTEFTSPEMLDMYKRLIRVDEELKIYREALAMCTKTIMEMGHPIFAGASSHTAFDMLGDGLRGTFGIMPDLYEQPENVLRFCETFAEKHIEKSLTNYKNTGRKYQWVMLHKGSEEFISDKMYKEFYWPYLHKWIMAMIDNGCTPVVFCQGTYTARLSYLADVPRGKVIYYFDNVDIKEAKRVLGDVACIMGGFPISTLLNGKPQQIKDKVKETMDVFAPGGSYIFSVGCSIDLCPRENMEAMFEAVELYGKY
jgi:uroporphyrinogen-III decarboxylase